MDFQNAIPDQRKTQQQPGLDFHNTIPGQRQTQQQPGLDFRNTIPGQRKTQQQPGLDFHNTIPDQGQIPQQPGLNFQNTILDPSPAQSASDTKMEVEFASVMGSRGAVKDSTGAVIYSVDYHMRSPHVRFRDVSTPNQLEGAGAVSEQGHTMNKPQDGDKTKERPPAFSSVTFHFFKTRIDLEFRNQVKVELKCTKILKGHYEYISPAFSDHTLSWKSASGWSKIDYVVSDEQGRALARFRAAVVYAGKKLGALEFDEDLVGSAEYGGGAEVDELTKKARREEILVIGSSLAYWVMLNTTAAII